MRRIFVKMCHSTPFMMGFGVQDKKRDESVTCPMSVYCATVI